MKKIKYIKQIIFVLTLVFSTISSAQETRFITLQIHKGITENDFEKKGMRLGFIIKDSKTIVGIDKVNSKVISFKDNNDKDLLQVHKNEINTYKKLVQESGINKVDRSENLIDFNETQVLPEGLGLVFDCWTVPEKNTRELHLIADISITTLATKESQSTVVKNIDFNTAKEISWLGRQISIKKSEYWGFGKEKYKYQLQNQDLKVSIQKIEQIDNKNNVINEITLLPYSNYTEFSLKEIDKPIHLKITYKRLENKLIHLDQKFGLGL